jgi:hypothetical protein
VLGTPVAIPAEVRTYAKQFGTDAAKRRDWHSYAATLAPLSVPVSDRPQYREAFEIAARSAIAEFN